MIKFPSQEEITILKDFKGPFCLTLYMPYAEPNVATNPNRIEFKNLLREAKEQLQSAGATTKDIKKTLLTVTKLIENSEFWGIRRGGLIVFEHPKLFRYYNVPTQTIPRLITVGNRFNINPLLRAIKKENHYFVLALSHKHVCLYEGDEYNLEPVKIKGFPADMKKTLLIDEYPKWRETYEIAPASMGKGSEGIHGQYNVSQVDKDFLLQFFRIVDKRLHKFLLKKQAPLILAGVSYLLPIYRQVNGYAYLIGKEIRGNFDYSGMDSIRKKALALLAKD